MTSKTFLSVLVLGLTTFLVGCQTSHPIVRGQSPNPMQPQSMQMSGPTPGPIYYDGPAGSGSQAGPSCPPNHCHPNGAKCPQCAPDNFWVPKHHHTYDYKQPSGLVYPQQNQPAGVVNYPYYTCKGPSDFFMK